MAVTDPCRCPSCLLRRDCGLPTEPRLLDGGPMSQTTPDTFALTPEEQEGIDIARAHQWAGDPKTKAAIESIVARFPREPVSRLSVRTRQTRPNSTYAATGGLSTLHAGWDFGYKYHPVTFKGRLYNADGFLLEWLWTSKSGGSAILAYATSTGIIGHTVPPEKLQGDLVMGLKVQYDISKFTRYRNVGVGLLESAEVKTPPFRLAELYGIVVETRADAGTSRSTVPADPGTSPGTRDGTEPGGPDPSRHAHLHGPHHPQGQALRPRPGKGARLRHHVPGTQPAVEGIQRRLSLPYRSDTT